MADLNIAELLGSYSQGMKALLAAAGLPQSQYDLENPATASTAPAAGGAPATSAAAPASPAMSPQQQFLQAAAKFGAHRKGGFNGLLEARAAANTGRRFGAAQGPTVLPGASTGSAAERLLQVAAQGPRAGQAFQSFQQGGRESHVYYDPKTGRRQVITLR